MLEEGPVTQSKPIPPMGVVSFFPIPMRLPAKNTREFLLFSHELLAEVELVRRVHPPARRTHDRLVVLDVPRVDRELRAALEAVRVVLRDARGDPGTRWRRRLRGSRYDPRQTLRFDPVQAHS